MNKYEIMDEYHKELESWSTRTKGDRALFWAGRMAQTIKAMTMCSPIQLSGYIVLFDLIREEYDQIIFSRLQHK